MLDGFSSSQLSGSSQYYEKIKKLGEGTSGQVWLYKDKRTHKMVAIKMIEGKELGVDGSGIREIKILKEVNQSNHQNIIRLHDVFYDTHYLHIVYEYCVTDLGKIINSSDITLSPSDIKRIFLDCLNGLEYCHRNYILHRDIKPQNILISPDFKHKLTDFGLSTYYATPRLKYTYHVCTSPYRAPELCLHASFYGPSVDVWAMGMVFAEVLLHGPLIQVQSDNDYEVLAYIFHIFGIPDKESWPGADLLDAFLEEMNEVKDAPMDLKTIFPQDTDTLLIDLISKMLVLNPNRRITAEEALHHPYFSSDPKPTPSEQLPYQSILKK